MKLILKLAVSYFKMKIKVRADFNIIPFKALY
jgi:hypothetical protein